MKAYTSRPMYAFILACSVNCDYSTVTTFLYSSYCDTFFQTVN